MHFAAWSTADQISLAAAITSVVALIANIVAAVLSWRSSSAASADAKKVADQSQMLQQQSLLLAMGTSETDFMDKLNGARQRAEELLATIQPIAAKAKKTADDKRLLESKAIIYQSTVEGYFNLLEVGCQRYLADKGDKEAFKKTYRKDLRTFVEQKDNKAIFELLHPSDISRYTAIWRVYREWEKSED
jgi:hypothetical protein